IRSLRAFLAGQLRSGSSDVGAAEQSELVVALGSPGRDAAGGAAAGAQEAAAFAAVERSRSPDRRAEAAGSRHPGGADPPGRAEGGQRRRLDRGAGQGSAAAHRAGRLRDGGALPARAAVAAGRAVAADAGAVLRARADDVPELL